MLFLESYQAGCTQVDISNREKYESDFQTGFSGRGSSHCRSVRNDSTDVRHGDGSAIAVQDFGYLG